MPETVKIKATEAHRIQLSKKFIEILQMTEEGQESADMETKEKAAKIGILIEECLNSKYKDLK